MQVKHFELFNEALLNLNELSQIRSGKLRGNILIDKLRSRSEISVGERSVIVDQMIDLEGEWQKVENVLPLFTDADGNYDIDKALIYFKNKGRFKKTFKSESGLEFSLNQIKKTQDFGSRGAGAKIREFETIQCIFLAIKQSFPQVNLNERNMLSFYKKYMTMVKQTGLSLIRTSEKIELTLELLDDFYSDFDWMYTFYKIPNRIWFANYVDKNQLYYIFHVGNSDIDSPYVNLSKKFREFSKSEDFKDINFTKWCPADVYLTSFNEKDIINNRINKCENINELTTLVDELFDSKSLIPISLKKLREGSQFKIIVNREIDKELPDFRLSSVRIGSDLKGIGSKIDTFSEWKYRNNKDVDTKKRTLNLDSSDTSKKMDIDGEVEGSSSRHGKISFKAIKRIIDNSGLSNIQQLDSSEKLKKLNIDELIELVKSLIEKSKSEIKQELLVVSPITRGSDISKSENKLISRIQSLQIVIAISQVYNNNPELSNRIITKIMRYALSIQTDKFNTPRYLRVI